MTLHLTPYDLAELVDDLVDRGLTRLEAEAQIAEWVRDRATADRLDELLRFESAPIERVDGDVLFIIIRALRAVARAVKRDPVKRAARKVRRAKRRAERAKNATPPEAP